MSQYMLPQNTYFCLTDDLALFLDLDGDRYVGLPVTEVHTLRAIINATPVLESRAVELAARLVEQRLLVRAPPGCKRAEPTRREPPRAALLEFDRENKPLIRGHHLINFLSAIASTSFALRGRSISYAVRRVRKRRARINDAARVPDLGEARNLVDVFRSLRPWFYTSKDQCVFDSFVLLEFLARYGIYPSWVFGARTAPFMAHCWIQHEGVVFNGRPESVGSFAQVLIA